MHAAGGHRRALTHLRHHTHPPTHPTTHLTSTGALQDHNQRPPQRRHRGPIHPGALPPLPTMPPLRGCCRCLRRAAAAACELPSLPAAHSPLPLPSPHAAYHPQPLLQRLAEIFGLTLPPWAKVLVAEVDVIGKEEPLSEEKLVRRGAAGSSQLEGKGLSWIYVRAAVASIAMHARWDGETGTPAAHPCAPSLAPWHTRAPPHRALARPSSSPQCPVLAMYRAADFKDAVSKADRLINLFGAGHTRWAWGGWGWCTSDGAVELVHTSDGGQMGTGSRARLCCCPHTHLPPPNPWTHACHPPAHHSASSHPPAHPPAACCTPTL